MSEEIQSDMNNKAAIFMVMGMENRLEAVYWINKGGIYWNPL